MSIVSFAYTDFMTRGVDYSLSCGEGNYRKSVAYAETHDGHHLCPNTPMRDAFDSYEATKLFCPVAGVIGFSCKARYLFPSAPSCFFARLK